MFGTQIFGRGTFYMKKKTKQTVKGTNSKKITVSAVMFYLLTLLIFFSAMGMIAVHLGVI